MECLLRDLYQLGFPPPGLVLTDVIHLYCCLVAFYGRPPVQTVEVAVLDRNETAIHIIASHILFNMQDLNSLPSRNSNSSGLKKVKIATNLYEVRLDKLDITLYKYDFVVPPDHNADSIRRLAKTLDRHSKGLRKISYIGRHGNGLMGEAKHEETITLL